jgi:hypothetical protein
MLSRLNPLNTIKSYFLNIHSDIIYPSTHKVKLSRYSPCRCQRGEKVWLLHILDLGPRWGEWSASRPGRALPPVPIVQGAGWASQLVWTQRLEEKSIVSAGNRTPVVQPVVRHYTDWATPALTHLHIEILNYIFPSGSRLKCCMCFLSLPCVLYAPIISLSSYLFVNKFFII